MTTSSGWADLIAGASSRSGVLRLVERLGIRTSPLEVSREAWPAYGLTGAPDVGGLWSAGRAGTLEALLVEMAPGAGADRLAWIARRVRDRNPARLHFFIFAAPAYRRVVLGVFSLEDAFLHLGLEPGAVRAADVETLGEMAPAAGEDGLALALTYARALDRSRVTRRFFADFRARRSAIAGAWTGLPEDASKERSQLALLFLCRLTFLYFVQRRGGLCGDPRYLAGLFGRWATDARRGPGSFYRRRLVPLFFGALNRRPEQREGAARALGALPYLNGGLFERHAFERRFPALDLADDEIRGLLEGLLERYRFTSREAGDEAAGMGVDPEILGRVFEGLMAPGQRTGTGSYYTPAPVVNRVVREALQVYVAGSADARTAAAVAEGAGAELPAETRYRVRKRLERVRVLDPACGSGAFLLGALARLARALEGLGGDPAVVRREVVARSLHGVDLLDDAALLCSLRLWLALSAEDGEIRPLPNLDRRIRQGDALIDPLDLASASAPRAGVGGPTFDPLRDPGTRRALRAVGPAARRYLESGPDEREALRAALAAAERELATRWIGGARRAEENRSRWLRARAADRDLFGEVTADARKAAASLSSADDRLAELCDLAAALAEQDALPFFSFGVHFAEAADGFDLIVSNPPWIRSHRWPDRLRRLASARYEVCRDAGWRRGAELAGAPPGVGAQIDLSLLFVERAIRLLAPGGVLAVLVPTKALRALYGGGARRILLRDLEIAAIEDHSLDQRSIFRADAFAAVLIARRRVRAEAEAHEAGEADRTAGEAAVAEATAGAGAAIRIRLERRHGAPAEFRAAQRDLPLFPEDPASPWVIAPPGVVAAIRAMQCVGPPLGRHPGLRVRRGIMTGANDVLLVPRAELKLGGLARIEAEGYERARRAGRSRSSAGRFRAYVETAALRPLVRGAGIDAFRYRTDGYVLWCHDSEAAPVEPPSRTARYLVRHRRALEARPGWRPPLPLGAVFRLTPETLRPKVAWHDLSDTLRAVALPAAVRVDGMERELVPLNTIYFLPVDDEDTAVLVTGLLNSLPARTFARAIAERAKDARFRFFAWTVSCLPLPQDWRGLPGAVAIAELSAAAHAAGGITPGQQARLDELAAELYDLDAGQLEALRDFDQWLRGDA